VQLQLNRQILALIVRMESGVHKGDHHYVQMTVEQDYTAQEVGDRNAVLASTQRRQHYQ
jgi:hypothetical protein